MVTPQSDPIPLDEKIVTLTIFDHNNKPTTLTEVLASGPERTLVIFIRHFYCGNCQDYIRALVNEPFLTPSESSKSNIVIIGCGDSSLIDSYKTQLSAPWDFYSDPTGEIYDMLGMKKSLAMGGRPKYIKSGILSGIWSGIVGGFKGGLLKGGNVSRNGGEFLWINKKLMWCHRMNNTRDHLEVPQLVALLKYGVAL